MTSARRRLRSGARPRAGAGASSASPWRDVLMIPGIPISIFPQTDFPRIVILVDNGIAPVNVQMLTVTRPAGRSDSPGSGHHHLAFGDRPRLHGDQRILPLGRGHSERAPPGAGPYFADHAHPAAGRAVLHQPADVFGLPDGRLQRHVADAARCRTVGTDLLQSGAAACIAFPASRRRASSAAGRPSITSWSIPRN